MLRLIEFANEQKYMDLFLSLSAAIYGQDKNYRPESEKEVVAWLRQEHPCTGFLSQKNLLVLDGERAVARGIAFANKAGNLGTIGFFECENNAKAVSMLVEGAKRLCGEHSIKKIYAPMNGSIWSSYRLMTKGFEDRPFMGEPYNRPYYKEVLEKCGFAVARIWESQFVKKISTKNNTADRFQNLEKIQRAKGMRVRSAKNFDEDIKTIHKIAMNAFSGFFAFHEIDEETFCALYGGLKLVCDKKTLKLAFNEQGEPVGFGLALPDYKSKLGALLGYAKRYIFLYIGTWQENGESAYPQLGKAIIVPIMKNLYFRRKSYICALLGEGAKTKTFAPSYEKVHEYVLMELDIEDIEAKTEAKAEAGNA